MSKEISIPFRDDMKVAMATSLKICTTRNKKYGDPEDYFMFWFNNMIFKCTLTRVEKNELGFVARWLFAPEGFQEPHEFVDIWTELHPRKGFVDTQVAWTHWFTVEIAEMIA